MNIKATGKNAALTVAYARVLLLSEARGQASAEGTEAVISVCAIVERAPACSAQIAARWLLPEPCGPTSSMMRLGQSGQRSINPSASALAA